MNLADCWLQDKLRGSEKFAEGMAGVNASFLTARVFEQEDWVISVLMTLP